MFTELAKRGRGGRRRVACSFHLAPNPPPRTAHLQRGGAHNAEVAAAVRVGVAEADRLGDGRHAPRVGFRIHLVVAQKHLHRTITLAS